MFGFIFELFKLLFESFLAFLALSFHLLFQLDHFFDSLSESEGLLLVYFLIQNGLLLFKCTVLLLQLLYYF